MEIKVCISVQANHEKYPHYVRETINDAALLEWAERYVKDNYTDDNKAVAIDVESIIP